jgi:hypothetical protein
MTQNVKWTRIFALHGTIIDTKKILHLNPVSGSGPRHAYLASYGYGTATVIRTQKAENTF